MGDARSQLWLTSALSDDDVAKALTLCFSLRKTMTNRKIGVIVCKQVSPTLRKILLRTFDILLNLEEEENSAGLRMEEFVKLYALTLKSFEKIVYLQPTMLAIKNSDEIFDENKHDTSKNSEWTEGENVSVLLVQPSLEAFGLLMKDLQMRNEKVSGRLNSYLNIWNKTQNEEQGIIRVLQGKYNCLMVPQNGFLVGNKTDISIIDLGDIPVKVDDDEKFGLLATLILREREQISIQAVQPLLESVRKNHPVDSLMLNEPFYSIGQPRHKKESIAIIGLSCRYPGANNLEEFWQLLLNGEDGTGTPPDFRWLREHSTVNPPGCRKTNAGFLKHSVDEFDSKFFGISPKEMELLDPQHRLLHELVWEALEDAAVTPGSIEGTNGGVFIGSWLADYKDIVTLSGATDIFRKYMGNSIGAGAARISHLLGLTGPSIATESGCSSAMVALHLACKSLQRKETNLALACGVNLLLRPYTDELSVVVSPDGRCKTFDAKADGYARAEGCGVLILKRFSEAVRDGDKIWALIRGSGMTQEGVSKSLGTPTVHCESLAMRLALQDARVLPQQVSYVETHGTGTAVGDPLEVAAIAKAYHSKWRKEPLLIGSVKTNVGHTESCSGITGIMKVVLAMQHELIPRHRNLETLNPAINLDAVPAKIPLKPVAWPKIEGEPRFAGVSSFGITGTDAHVILEESPLLSPHPLIHKDFERPLHIMKISAKTSEALELLLEKYKDHFKQGGSGNETLLSDLAYTANVGRADFNHRAVILASSSKEAAKNIEHNKMMRGVAGNGGKICFLFTGQGSQYLRMVKQLYETSPVFRMHFEYCDNILKQSYNIDITPVLWSPDAAMKELSRTIYSQTSIFCVEFALMKLWESWGIKPDVVLGHSLGEFAAAVCCGILSVEDGIKLVAERSRLIEQLPHGKMLVIKTGKEKVDSLMNKFARNEENRLLDYAALNSSEQTVVAGDSELIDEFAACCKEAKLKCIVLASSHAFHSKHMDPILDEYRQIAATTVRRMEGGGCKYISGMRGMFVEANEIDENYWVQHTREKVMFMNASKQALELGCNIFIEIGPQPVLSALTMMNNDAQLLCLPSVRNNENEWETLLNTLGKLYLQGIEIDWKGFEQFYQRNKVRLPHYPFIGRKFWTEVRAPISNTSISSIHPLLGSPIPSPLSAKLFQSTFNLKSLEYVKDHCIGDKVIFPGAGYLEMCLAAGHASLHRSSGSLLPPPNFPMKVENLSIHAPLQLHDSISCQVQTVVESTENQLTVKIFRHEESKSGSDIIKWVPHAEANFSVAFTSSDHATIIPVPFDTETFRETLKQPANEKLAEELYKKLVSVSLHFGNTFQSLEKMWKNENKKSLVAKIKLPAGEDNGYNEYVIHPVVLDAMLQATIMLCHVSSLKRKLCIPIKIGKFLWLSGTDSKDVFVQVDNSTANATAYLIDGEGKLLAVMWSVEFIETTVKAIESVLEEQKNAMPEMWEEVWKKEVGSGQHDVDLEKANKRFYTAEFANQVESKYNLFSSYETETLNLIEQLSYLNILRGIYECGWKPELDQVFETDSLFMELKIEKSLKLYFNFILTVLEKEEILKIIKQTGTKTTTWQVARVPSSLEVVKTTLNSSIFTDLVRKFQSTLLISKFGENLAAILQGKKSSRSILFPEEEIKTCASLPDLYEEYGNVFKRTEGITGIFRKRLSHIRETMKGEYFILRVLELGNGDRGSHTNHFLKCLEEEGLEFEYTFTNPSDLIFSTLEKSLEKHGKQTKFMELNIDQDPIEQGFTPESFDYILMADVLQATKDLPMSLRNINMLLKPFGKFDILEEIGGHFRFLSEPLHADREFDKTLNHPVQSTQIWTGVLKKVKFDVEGIFPMLNNLHVFICAQKQALLDMVPLQLNLSPIITTSKTWLVFHDPTSPTSTFLINKIYGVARRKIMLVTYGNQFEDIGNTLTVRKLKEDDFVQIFNLIKKRRMELEGILYCWALDKKLVSQDEILQPYFNLAKAILATGYSVSSKLIALINGGVVPLAGNDLSHFHTSTLWGFTKSLKNENADLDCRCIQLSGDNQNEKQMQNVFQEIWRHRKESMVAFDENSRYIPKLQPLKMTKIMRNTSLSLPKGSDRFQLIIPATKTMSDLQFGSLDTNVLKDDEVEVHIIAAALNFRDVLNVLKPSDEFTNNNSVGGDFAGVVIRKGKGVTRWEVGDRVFGCNIHFTEMRTHITLEQDLVLPLPQNLNFCEGATITVPYVTSLQSLKEIARIQKEDTVLIHTASGGVGLSAIEICKHVGCTIIVTAGSSRKRNYLKSLGIHHVFHSRSTKYADQVLEVTNGRGVDVVLNSLTSPGFKEATLKTCAKGARFVEMSKLNIWKKEQVKHMRPDVQYTIVDVTKNSRDEWIRIFKHLAGYQTKNVVKPIPYVRFDALNVGDALEYMQQTKHIGKIVCRMPEMRNEGGEMKVFTPLFNETSTYLITGGLGGIGFVVCQWMVCNGAKHVLLAGRSPPDVDLRKRINEMNSQSANVIPVQLDVGNLEQCKHLIEVRIGEMKLPPLKGVMHCAAALADGLVINQQWDRFNHTFKAKISGTLNLHELTKSLNLEHFVLFSSITSLFGYVGQSNYAAGNGFQDAIAQYRNSVGLPSTSINWGPWSEVGLAADVDLPGFKGLSSLQGISGLEFLLRRGQRTQTAIFSVSSFKTLSNFITNLASYFDERVWNGNVSTTDKSMGAIESSTFWDQYSAALELVDKMNILKTHLKSNLKNMLKLDESDAIGDDLDMQELGVDSLMFVEIKNLLQTLLGKKLTLTPSSIRDCSTVTQISNRIVALIEGTHKMGIQDKPTRKEVNELMREDSKLAEHIHAKPSQRIGSVTEIQRVLLTGSTGTFGPYVLKLLTNLPQITQVVCLMRKVKQGTLEERLERILSNLDLVADVDMRKVKCVTGNLAENYLGMESIVWEELSGNIDAIFNCAASVQHVEYYRKREGNQNHMRAVNIGGVENVLKFACENKLKHVYHASTIFAVASLDEETGHVSENWPNVGDFDGITTLGYPNTKFVGDVLMKQAVERGIPCKVFRFPWMSGESRTGRCVVDYNHALLRHLFILKSGVISSEPFVLPMLPVDVCADMSLQLFFNEKTKSEIYNVIHTQPDVDQEFVNVAKEFGYAVNIVMFSEFAKHVLEESGSPLEPFKELYQDEETFMSTTANSAVLGMEVREGKRKWWSAKFEKFALNFLENQKRTMDYVRQDLNYCKSQGWFDKFGF